jgi:hypothetical protein
MTASKDDFRRHTLRTFEHDEDRYIACCVGCSWRSDPEETKRDARRAHSDHVLSERLKPHTGEP